MNSFVNRTSFNRRIAFVLLLLSFFYNQSYSIGWIDSTFKSQKVFLENKGQFDGRNHISNSTILFGVDDGVEILFTKKGLSYRFNKVKKEESGDEKEEEKSTVSTSFVHIEWLNANANTQVLVEDEVQEYWNYLDPQNPNKSFNNINGYKKLIYKNLYPNIDVEYVFHPIAGIKYSLILHPGADASNVKMQYTGADKIFKDENGNINFIVKEEEYMDYAPITFYESNHASIISSFKLVGNTVQFELDNYDKTKTIVIDPWTVAGFMSPANIPMSPYEITSDAANNVSVLSKRIGNGTGYIQKYNAAGVLQWTTTIAGPTWFDSGDIIAEPGGILYVTDGLGTQPSATLKLNPAGGIIWNNRPSANFAETSRIAFNCDNTKLTIAGARMPCCGIGIVAEINVATGAESNVTFPPSVGDIVSTCFSPNGYFYGIGTKSNGANPPFPTKIFCLDPATAYSTVFNIPANFVRLELFPSQNYGPSVINGIAADCNFLYTFNGDVLTKRDLLTGAIIATIVIPGGQDIANSGLKLDKCGNIYVGSTTGVFVYDNSLTLLNTFPTPQTVADIAIGSNGVFYVCGGDASTSTSSYIAQFSLTTICPTAIPVTTTPTPCGAQTGTATANPTFCSAPYTYTWLTSPVQNTQTATGLAAGTYTVIVSGAGACSITDSAIAVVAGTGGTIVATTVATPALCASNTGTATVTPTGGTPNYSYVWSPSGGTNQTATGLAPGTYTVTVTDINGCTQTATATVVLSNGTLTSSSTSTPSVCTSNNGTATITPSGGTPGYTYNWTPSGGTGATASNLAPGTYIVTVTDTNGCVTIDTAVVLQTSGTLISSATATPSLCTSNNGTATVTASGGTPTYTYNWTPSGGAGATASNLAPGTYTITVTDASGCTSTTTATVAQSSGTLNASVVTTPSLCTSNNGTATVTPTGGTAGYTYSWTPSGGAGATENNLAPATYTVTVTDASGCTQTATGTVAQSSGTLTATSTTIPDLCNAATGSATINVTGGTIGYTYVWSPAVGAGASVSNLANGTYTVTVTDANGCVQTVTVTVASVPGPTAAASPNVSIALGDSSSLNATGGGTYNWFPTTGLSCTTCANPIAKPTQTTTYCVEVTDANGCKDTACVTVQIETPCPTIEKLAVPNAFSPNTDGINDDFCLLGWDACLEEFKVLIYDRWGEKVFESIDPNFCWDGKHLNKQMDAQVFVYYIKATYVNSDEAVVKSGNISLIR